MEEYLSYCEALAKTYVKKYYWLEFEEVQAEFYLSLVECYNKYNSTKGTKFTTYLYKVLYNKLQLLLKKDAKNIELLEFDSTLQQNKETTSSIIVKTDKLTKRQSEILYLLTQGYKQTEIAKKLGITKASVSQTVKLIKSKFEVVDL